MNKHFHDSLYYCKRATTHLKLGVAETVTPVIARGRAIIGREKDQEPSRIEVLLDGAHEVERNAEATARTAITTARTTVDGFRANDRTDHK